MVEGRTGIEKNFKSMKASRPARGADVMIE